MAAGRVLKLSAILLYFTLLNFYCKSNERQHIEGTFTPASWCVSSFKSYFTERKCELIRLRERSGRSVACMVYHSNTDASRQIERQSNDTQACNTDYLQNFAETMSHFQNND